ncbi:MAG TPA: hypothetical protein VFH61_08110, partial [Thermoleophilia bacterium]|nr:hypothetical protein [Thermoleophilia bacterium]
MTGLKSLGQQGDKSTAAVTKIGKAAQRAGASIQSGLGRMGVQSLARLKFAAVAAGAAFIAIGVASARAGIMIAAQRDAQIRGLAALMGSLELAQKHFEELQVLAKLPGVGLEQALLLSNRLQAAGKSAEFAKRSIMAFGNAIALAGQDASVLPLIAKGLTDIASSPIVKQQDLYQLLNNIPILGKTIIDLYGSLQSSEINKQIGSTAEFLEDLLGALERAPKAADTFANTLFNLGMTWQNIEAEFGAGVIGSGDLQEGLQDLDATLNSMSGDVRNLGESLGATLRPALIGVVEAAKEGGILAGMWAGFNASMLQLTFTAERYLYVISSWGKLSFEAAQAEAKFRTELWLWFDAAEAVGVNLGHIDQQYRKLEKRLRDGKMSLKEFTEASRALVEQSEFAVMTAKKQSAAQKEVANTATEAAGAVDQATAATRRQAEAATAAVGPLGALARAYRGAAVAMREAAAAASAVNPPSIGGAA